MSVSNPRTENEQEAPWSTERSTGEHLRFRRSAEPGPRRGPTTVLGAARPPWRRRYTVDPPDQLIPGANSFTVSSLRKDQSVTGTPVVSKGKSRCHVKYLLEPQSAVLEVRRMRSRAVRSHIANAFRRAAGSIGIVLQYYQCNRRLQKTMIDCSRIENQSSIGRPISTRSLSNDNWISFRVCRK